MTLPGPVPPRLQRAWEKRDQTQREALEILLLGKTNGEWDKPADWLAIVLTASGDSISASTVRTYRRALTFLEGLTK